MLPVLIDIGFIKIHTLGVFYVLAFFWGSFFLWKNISLTSFKEDQIFDALFVGLFGSLVFGRVAYVLMNFDDFGFNILRYILLNGYPGIHFLSSLVGFIIFIYLFSVNKKFSFMKFIDYMIPPILLTVGIGKLGAFFSGSEIGSQTNFFLSLAYPNLDGVRHLTAFYEAILYFVGAYFAYQIVMQIRRQLYYPGFSLIIGVLIVSLITVVLDNIYAFRTVVGGLYIDFWVSLILVLTTSGYVVYYFREHLLQFVKNIYLKTFKKASDTKI